MSMVNYVMKRANDKQQQAIGQDKLINEQLILLNEGTRHARKIDKDSEHYTDDDIDSILHDNYRKD